MAKTIDVEDFGESVANDIKSIAQCLRNTKLKDDALVILLSAASGINRSATSTVLKAMQHLEDRYIK